MSEARPAGTKRPLWITVLALALGSAALWGSSRLAGEGDGTWRVPLALVALASVGAVLATAGLARRVLGALLLVAGVGTLYLAIAGAGETAVPGLLTALAGGLLAIAAGVALASAGHRMPKLGAKYSAPGAKRAEKEPDEELWNALSDGEDPTTSG